MAIAIQHKQDKNAHGEITVNSLTLTWYVGGKQNGTYYRISDTYSRTYSKAELESGIRGTYTFYKNLIYGPKLGENHSFYLTPFRQSISLECTMEYWGGWIGWNNARAGSAGNYTDIMLNVKGLPDGSWYPVKWTWNNI